VNLRELDLAGSQVTDAGLEHLYGLTALEHLDLADTDVTERAIRALAVHLPNCEIFTEYADFGPGGLEPSGDSSHP
jgi:hypothetical protein